MTGIHYKAASLGSLLYELVTPLTMNIACIAPMTTCFIYCRAENEYCMHCTDDNIVSFIAELTIIIPCNASMTTLFHILQS